MICQQLFEDAFIQGLIIMNGNTPKTRHLLHFVREGFGYQAVLLQDDKTFFITFRNRITIDCDPLMSHIDTSTD